MPPSNEALADLYQALQIGVACGIVLITILVGVGPGKKETVANDSSGNAAVPVPASAPLPDVLREEAEEEVLAKMLRAQKVLGLDEDDMRTAIRNARDQAAAGGGAAVVGGGGISLSRWADVVIYSVLMGAFVYFMNRDYGGGATALFVQIFPREAAVLGIR
eukprot:CAMPEP_0194325446 /NCGR_PEP_ID=MMETSP0171-20130528/30752_1 /TAXON_ID=218684 /ORGANISM="Corethron pennatum, Strain L29A3" /LENGTH=161 /DNA_ID=CAMNT_0039084597 /DNA_START=169 /DNA_END=654 /DNA_ORIENTATION=+